MTPELPTYPATTGVSSLVPREAWLRRHPVAAVMLALVVVGLCLITALVAQVVVRAHTQIERNERTARAFAAATPADWTLLEETEGGDSLNMVSRPRLEQVHLVPGNVATVKRQVESALAAASLEGEPWREQTLLAEGETEQSLVAQRGVQQVFVTVSGVLNQFADPIEHAPEGSLFVKLHFEPSR